MLYNEDMDFYEASSLPAGIDLEQDYIFREEQEIIKEVLETLPESVNKEIVKLNYGFYDRKYSQREIAEKLNCSRSIISRIIKSTK